MNNTNQMLVVDDENDICETLAEYFLLQGFEVKIANNGQQLREVLTHFTPHIVLLDLNMPGENGLSILRYLREHTSAGVIMVTAASSQVDKVVGLEMGADDYVGKPFDLRELLARVKSVLRRTQATSDQPVENKSHQGIRVGKCRFDVGARKLWEGAEEIPLTSLEYDLLMVFVNNANRPLSRDTLLSLSHKRDADPFDRSIDSRITRLRKKIEVDPEKPTTIKTVRSLGYVFVAS